MATRCLPSASLPFLYPQDDRFADGHGPPRFGFLRMPLQVTVPPSRVPTLTSAYRAGELLYPGSNGSPVAALSPTLVPSAGCIPSLDNPQATHLSGLAQAALGS